MKMGPLFRKQRFRGEFPGMGSSSPPPLASWMKLTARPLMWRLTLTSDPVAAAAAGVVSGATTVGSAASVITYRCRRH